MWHRREPIWMENSYWKFYKLDKRNKYSNTWNGWMTFWKTREKKGSKCFLVWSLTHAPCQQYANTSITRFFACMAYAYMFNDKILSSIQHKHKQKNFQQKPPKNSTNFSTKQMKWFLHFVCGISSIVLMSTSNKFVLSGACVFRFSTFQAQHFSIFLRYPNKRLDVCVLRNQCSVVYLSICLLVFGCDFSDFNA